ncbi:MAG: hypothetical protein V4686_03125 [Patescibacteria group bacterium]
MNEGLEALTEQIKKLQQTVDENHVMLVSIQRRARVSIIFSGLKWLIILGITFGSFIYLQPYLDQVFQTYSSLGSLTDTLAGVDTATSTEDVNQAEGLINAIRAYMPR